MAPTEDNEHSTSVPMFLFIFFLPFFILFSIRIPQFILIVLICVVLFTIDSATISFALVSCTNYPSPSPDIIIAFLSDGIHLQPSGTTCWPHISICMPCVSGSFSRCCFNLHPILSHDQTINKSRRHLPYLSCLSLFSFFYSFPKTMNIKIGGGNDQKCEGGRLTGRPYSGVIKSNPKTYPLKKEQGITRNHISTCRCLHRRFRFFLLSFPLFFLLCIASTCVCFVLPSSFSLLDVVLSFSVFYKKTTPQKEKKRKTTQLLS
jgi:hypothetical protein